MHPNSFLHLQGEDLGIILDGPADEGGDLGGLSFSNEVVFGQVDSGRGSLGDLGFEDLVVDAESLELAERNISMLVPDTVVGLAFVASVGATTSVAGAAVVSGGGRGQRQGGQESVELGEAHFERFRRWKG